MVLHNNLLEHNLLATSKCELVAAFPKEQVLYVGKDLLDSIVRHFRRASWLQLLKKNYKLKMTYQLKKVSIATSEMRAGLGLS